MLSKTGFFLMGRLVVCLPLAGAAFAAAPEFGPLLSLPAQKASLAITTADFNGDGILDLAVSNAGVSTISIFLGLGAGKFSSASTSNQTLSCQAAYLATGNFTGATSPDLLAVCPLGGLFVLPNTGGGTFGSPLSTLLPSSAWVGNLLLGSIHPAIADFNGDGHLDIAIQTFDTDSGCPGWFLLPGKGNGTFKPPLDLPFSGLLPLSLATADFNGDGNADLVASGYDDNGNAFLAFAAGNGDGSFQIPILANVPASGTFGSLLLAADVNGDGKPDVVVTGSSLLVNIENVANGTGVPASGVLVFLGDGKGNLKLGYSANESTDISGAALANILGTGKLDLVESVLQGAFLAGGTPTGLIQVRAGNGDGTFGAPVALPSFPSTTVPTDIAVGDFNGDGHPDFAVSSEPASPINILGNLGLNSDLNSILPSVLSQLPNGAAAVLLNLTAGPTSPNVTSGSAANGATYASGGLVPGSWAQVKGSNLATVHAYTWQSADFAGLGNNLPTNLKGTSVTVNGLPAAVYYADPSQVNFQVPTGVSGTASVQVSVNDVAGNIVTAGSSNSSPGIFPVIVNGVNYAGGVFTDNKYIGDPSVSSAFRNAKPGDVVQLFATALTATPSGVLITPQGVSGVTVTIGPVTFPADFAGLVAVGEFQINFTVPQQFATMPAAAYPITIAVNGVSSPATINSTPSGPVVIPIQP
jgi:uncharacterized protein (TIGR03437 family)